MTQYDDLHAALDDLVGRSPLVLGRRGAVMNRIEAVQRRRKAAVQVVVSAFVVAFAAAGATHVIRATPTGSDRLFVEPTHSESPRPEPVHTEPAHTESPRPAESHAPEPTHAVEPPRTESPKPAESHAPQPTTEPAPAAAGLMVGLAPYGDGFTAGTEMHWKVYAKDGAGRAVRIEVSFGDGTYATFEPSEPCRDGMSLSRLVAHTYTNGGAYTAHARVTTADCGAATEAVTAESHVTVKPKPSTESTNGPAAPTVEASQVAGDAAKLALVGHDADGWVSKFVVYWGDGTESVVGPRSYDGCVNAGGTSHPPASSWDPQATHTYGAPGTYSVKVYVVSTSCTGTGVQGGSITMSITA